MKIILRGFLNESIISTKPLASKHTHTFIREKHPVDRSTKTQQKTHITIYQSTYQIINEHTKATATNTVLHTHIKTEAAVEAETTNAQEDAGDVVL